MIDNNNSEINVDELMEQVREEVARRKSKQITSNDTSIGDNSLLARSLSMSRFESLLEDARINSQNLEKLPNKFNRFPFNQEKIRKTLLKLYNFTFKKQQVVNQDLIEAIGELERIASEKNRALEQKHEQRHQALEQRHQALEQRHQALEQRHQALEQKLNHQIKALQLELSHSQRAYADLLKSLRSQTGGEATTSSVSSSSAGEDHLLDAFYVAFEERFRGSYNAIAERLAVYLPYIERANPAQANEILDLGCGRGEWLELLQNKGYKAKGIDLNQVMLEECRSRNLEVYEADAIAHLRNLPDNSLSAVTGFHIIEHLPFPALLRLLQETLRVLQPGGVAIFETPNPQNVLVSSRTFYLDPTHRNPLPGELVQFVLDNAGFDAVEILPLHPYNAALKIEGAEELTQRFNEYFYGPQDYAVIGYKPCNPLLS
ncbi:class I SAM-dependent methyltransferase [Oscillatoria sp. FACHB-1406]|uniref:class I SAM-dependent methyltransferase n=1 Tax=Oscillatoria sp. FACHB-1406 TaxID=2692846 RepID=UPI0016842BB3|nr:class I SAM-dependent methyltransferase [Oscillatoria sp. FACHB-1406]MBD2577183.1 methyltransferase domain-containing protein [Oscillatoria sp. FACHB-1406]